MWPCPISFLLGGHTAEEREAVFNTLGDGDGSGMGRRITVPLWEKLLRFKAVHFKFLRKNLTEEFCFFLFFFYFFTLWDNCIWVCKRKMMG